MSLGFGIFLFVVGAILAFALNIDTGGVIDLHLVGYLLMGAGALIAIIGGVLLARRRTSTSTERVVHADGTQSVAERRTSTTPDPNQTIE